MSDLALAAAATTMDMSAAELHGTVCGVLCADYRRRLLMADSGGDSENFEADDPYDREYRDEDDEDDDDDERGDLGGFPLEAYLALVGTDAVQDADALLEFVHLTSEELFSDDLRFMPLLPDDDEPVSDRVDAMAEWSAAFLAGFGALGDIDLSDDETDVLEDLSAIGSAEVGSVEEEEAERMYTDVVEYLKVTVLMLMQPDSGVSE